MDLLRLALERAETAAEAVEVLTELLAAHGQGGGCGHEDRSFTYHNSFIVADPTGAFVFETAGRHVAVEKVQGARTISNRLTIPEFRKAHREFLKSHFSRSKHRQARTQALAEQVDDVGGLMKLLRDHGTGHENPSWSLLTGCMDVPCMHAGGIAANSQSTASWVAELSPGKCQHWVTATAAPCTGLFKPVRVDDPLDFGPSPDDQFDASALWWRHERLHRQVLADYDGLSPLFKGERDDVEAIWLTNPPDSRAAFDEGDRLLDAWTKKITAASGGDKRPAWTRRFWRSRNRRANWV
jgi:secernin